MIDARGIIETGDGNHSFMHSKKTITQHNFLPLSFLGSRKLILLTVFIIVAAALPVFVNFVYSDSVVVTISTIGSQVGTMDIPSGAQYVGGAFAIKASGPTSITRIIITEGGTVIKDNLSGIHLHYDLSTTGDCASESFSESDPTYGFATAFLYGASQATFTGSVGISSTQTFCAYVVLDVGSGAVNGSTIEFLILDPGNDVIASGGASVCPILDDGTPTCLAPLGYIPISGTTVLRLLPPPVVTVTETGNQASLITVPSSAKYIGGAFRMFPDSGSTSIDRVTITQNGNVDSGFLSSVHLHYDLDATAPYDCASESFSESDPIYGLVSSFGFNNKVIFEGSVGIDTSHALCFYVVLDVLSGVSDNQTLEIEISNPSVDVVVSGNASVSLTAPVRLNGTTMLSAPPSSVVVVDAIGNQAPFLTIPSVAQHIGGAFRMMLETGSATISRIIITENGTTLGGSLSSVHIHYDLDATAPYDCASESFSENDLTYGFSVNLSAFGTNTATFDGGIEVKPTQAVCVYVVVDVRSDAQGGETIEFEITHPKTDIVSTGGATISPSTPVVLSGTTILSLSPPAAVTVDTIGTQTPIVNIPSSSQYIGGAFRMILDTGSIFITRVAVSAGGTGGSYGVSKISLRYDLDVTSPYNCASETYAATDTIYGTPADFAGYATTAVFTDALSITPTQAICFYVVLDIGENAVNGTTLEIMIPTPSTEVIASGSTTVSPSQYVDLQGTTVLSTTSMEVPPPTDTTEIRDGDLIRASGAFDIYIVKLVGSKMFRRLILNPDIFNQYGHLKWSNVKNVDRAALNQYTDSQLVRCARSECPNPDIYKKVYQLVPTGEDTAAKHWITSAEDFIAGRFDWDQVYEINAHEHNNTETGADYSPFW